MKKPNRQIVSPDQSRFRIRIFIVCQAIITSLLLGRFFLIQVVRSEFYAKEAKTQSLREVNLQPDRGQIFDKNGICLAINTSLDSANLQKLRYIVRNGGGKPPKRSINRLYPMKTTAGHVLGFVGRDGYGLAGVEYGFDRELYGEAGWAIARIDARARRIYEPSLPMKEPVEGFSISLTIDVNVQEIIESCLAKGIDKTGSAAGAVIVMDTKNGDILGIASYPQFDPNFFSQQDDNAWRNNGIGMVYEPGSTFKIIAAAAALEEGTFREEDIIKTDGGAFHIYDQVIRDAHKHGDLTFRQAVAVSSNVAFAKIAMSLGEKTFVRYIRNFGFGQKLGIDLPGEEAGLLKPVERWSGRTLVTLAMGQEIGTTLMQMGAAYCVIANGGILYAPRIVSATYKDGKVIKKIPPRPIRRVISQKTAKRLTECLTAVVENDSGTGTLARISGVPVAGKTGTAQKIDPITKKYVKGKYVASFAGFFPANNPMLLCMVILDEPQGTYYGGTTAGPVFREVVTRILHSQNLPYGSHIFGTNFAHAPIFVDSIPVPDFRNKSLLEADELSEISGLKLNIQGNGQIVKKQSVKVGKTVLKGSLITLNTAIDTTISTSKEIPDVVGMTLRDAIRKLSLWGYDVRVSGKGKVIRQNFEAASFGQQRIICHLEAG